MYYDYSEQFEKEAHPVPQGPTVPLGFVQRIRTILEERNKGGTLPTSPSGSIPVIAELPGSEIAELPGSPASPMTPAVKRITRELILAAMSPSSEVPSTGENTATDCEAEPKIQNKEDPKEDAQLPDESKSVSAEKWEDSMPGSFPRTSAESSGSAVIDPAVAYSMPGSFDSRSSEVDLLLRNAQPASKAEASSIETQSGTKAPEDQSPPITATFEQAMLPSAQRPHSTMLPSIPPAALDNELSISNNRFSAPSSQYSPPHDGIDGLSQAITDFAQRFSVPQYVAVQEPPTNSPLLAAAVSPIAVTITDATTTNTDLSASVPPHSVSPVSALEETPNSRDSNTTTHLVWPQRRAISAAEILDVAKQSETAAFPPQDSVAAPRGSLPRSSPSHLSDVKEEPGEEGSIPDFRVASFRFPLPKAASLRISTEKNRLSESSHRISTRRNTCGTLSDTRGIPSLNFSKTDLFAKLNEAFEHRAFRSVDGIPQMFPELHAPVPERPASSGPIRDKYRSLFTSLDNVNPMAEETIQDPTMTVLPTHRPLSPDELIAEVDRLSIPSVNQLTQRLSELLPSLKRYCSNGDQDEGVVGDDTVESTINAIRGLGRHEPVAKEADLELLDNIEQHKPAPRNLDGQRTEEFADTPDETTDSSNNLSSADKRRSAASAGSAHRTPVAELEAPLPAVIRVKSAGGDAEEDLEQKRSLMARVSRRSLVSSPSARPWNFEASYPWGSSPMVDISFAAPTHQRDGPERKPSRLRLRVSNSSFGSRDTVKPGSGGSPTTGDNTENTNDTFKRKASKKSMIGSIKRKIGLGSPIDNSGYATGPHPHHREERAVDPGDRYPTTGLSPPSNFNIEECRSFFSDDSSQTHRNNSFRKRLTHLKAKLPPMARSHSAMDSRSIGNRSDSLIGDHAANGDSVRTHDGPGGMSKTEFRARRLLEKVKMLWFRSGELIRSMSGRKKQEEAHAWIEESEISVYSGV